MQPTDLRVKLLEVGLDQVIFDNLNKLVLSTLNWNEVSSRLKRTVVDLSNELHGIGWIELCEAGLSIFGTAR